MTEQQTLTLRQSLDSRALKQAALAVLDSNDPADFQRLGEYLATRSFLERLDSSEAYQGAFVSLRLARVVKKLMDLQEPPATQVLLGLIQARDFQDQLLRIQLLVHALAVIKPSPAEAIAYWDRCSGPGSPLAYDVVEALCINQSGPATALLEQKLANPAHDENAKKSWLRQLVLPRRNDEALLLVCERLLQKPLAPELSRSIVEALFDYQREAWYRGCSPPEPPPRVLASAAAKETLRRIARRVTGQPYLTPELQVKVEAYLKEPVKSGESA